MIFHYLLSVTLYLYQRRLHSMGEKIALPIPDHTRIWILICYALGIWGTLVLAVFWSISVVDESFLSLWRDDGQVAESHVGTARVLLVLEKMCWKEQAELVLAVASKFMKMEEKEATRIQYVEIHYHRYKLWIYEDGWMNMRMYTYTHISVCVCCVCFIHDEWVRMWGYKYNEHWYLLIL